MAELDPYAILGVPRAASREEIARAYRRLAKLHHPDAGAPVSPTMSRINEAWHVLSDPQRRGQWDRAHTIVQPVHRAPARTEPIQRRPPPATEAPASLLSSGRAAVLVAGGVAVLIGAVMLGIYAVLGPSESRFEFRSDEIVFKYEPGWSLYSGDGQTIDGQRVIAHLASFGLPPEEQCISPGEPCHLVGETMPEGEVSVVFTAWSEGTLAGAISLGEAGQHEGGVVLVNLRPTLACCRCFGKITLDPWVEDQ